jgi:hypothetical protein
MLARGEPEDDVRMLHRLSDPSLAVEPAPESLIPGVVLLHKLERNADPLPASRAVEVVQAALSEQAIDDVGAYPRPKQWISGGLAVHHSLTARRGGHSVRDEPWAFRELRIAEAYGRTVWLNPEPRLYWNYGDSVIAAYERHCTAFECWPTDQLEEFVKVLSRDRRTTGVG